MEDSNSVAETIHDEQQSAKDADAGRLHEVALSEVLTVVMDSWQWPKPVNGQHARDFSLVEWLTDSMDAYELSVFVVGLMDEQTHYHEKMRLEKLLRAHLSTSDIVAERVAMLRAEERNES